MVGETVPLMVWAWKNEDAVPEFLFQGEAIRGPDQNFHLVIDQRGLPLAIEQMLEHIGESSDR